MTPSMSTQSRYPRKKRIIYRSHLNTIYSEKKQKSKKRDKSSRKPTKRYAHISKFNIPENEVVIFKDKILGSGRFGKV